MSPMLPLPAWHVLATIFQTFALGTTTFRIYRRFKMKNMWWDDYLAMFAYALDLVYSASIGLRLEVGGGAEASPQERHRRIVLFWISSTLPPLIVWSARISICLSIARMDIQYTTVRIRLWVYALSLAFGFVGGAMVSQKIWTCAGQTAWHHGPNIQCAIGKILGYISLTGDISADTTLTIISLRLLWKVRMRRSRRRLLSWLSAANILSSLVGIPYGILVICADRLGPHRTLIIALIVHIKTATTLTVCNLLVVVTYLYARFWKSSEDSDSDSETSQRRHPDPPSGRTTKPSGIRRNTILILTELNSDGSVMTWNQRTRGGITSTFMTWAGPDRGWVPRAPPPALINSRSMQQVSTSVPIPAEDYLHLPTLSRARSEPSTIGRSPQTTSSSVLNKPAKNSQKPNATKRQP